MNFQESKKVSSIKCHHPPGGSTNFSLGWGNINSYNQPTSQRSLKRSDSKTDFNIITGEAYNLNVMNVEEKENMNVSNKETISAIEMVEDTNTKTMKAPYDYSKQKMNLFDTEKNLYSEKTSSIKITYAPGGKSNVFLGDDKTSYEEYRKKR
jgi:hypothetical protein